ncbi:MAG TPA: hypothetical protein VFL55_06730 [Acetobacteraceae bacterium]|nr:hypothetical protein [Acetobacteraceae bacterium]
MRDYDSIKVAAVLNQIDAKHSTGFFVGHVPAVRIEHTRALPHFDH